MKPLYKSTKVIYDAHLKEYEVYYRNWFFWNYDCSYRFDENPKIPNSLLHQGRSRETSHSTSIGHVKIDVGMETIQFYIYRVRIK